MTEPLKLDLDSRQYIEVRFGAADIRVYAPPMSKTPELATFAKRIEAGSDAFKTGDATAAHGLIETIADYVALYTTDIPREKVLDLDLVRALKLMKGLQELLPKGEASPVLAGN